MSLWEINFVFIFAARSARIGNNWNAQMAELVDALVSNTNEVTLVPVRLRLRVLKAPKEILGPFFYFSDILISTYWISINLPHVVFTYIKKYWRLYIENYLSKIRDNGIGPYYLELPQKKRTGTNAPAFPATKSTQLLS